MKCTGPDHFTFCSDPQLHPYPSCDGEELQACGTCGRLSRPDGGWVSVEEHDAARTRQSRPFSFRLFPKPACVDDAHCPISPQSSGGYGGRAGGSAACPT